MSKFLEINGEGYVKVDDIENYMVEEAMKEFLIMAKECISTADFLVLRDHINHPDT